MGNAIERVLRSEKEELIEFAGENYGGRTAFWPDHEEQTRYSLVIVSHEPIVGVLLHLTRGQLEGFFERLKRLPAYMPVPSD
jgi:hypothetical protein